MARPTQDAIDTFMAITGASEAVAVQKLEEHHGDLNGAVNAHFNEGDRVNTHDPSPAVRNDFMDVDDPIDVDVAAAPIPSLPTSRRLNPFSLLDPTFSVFESGELRGVSNRAPRVSHPREVREIPIEFKDENNQSSSSRPVIEDVTESTAEHGPAVQGTVIIDDEDEDLVPPAQDERRNNEYHFVPPAPSAPQIDNVTDFDNEIEEQMIRAAIEASKQEVSHSPEIEPKPPLQDVEYARAVSLSLKTADEERAPHDEVVQVGFKGPSSSSRTNLEEQGEMSRANGRQEFNNLNDGTSSRSRSEDEDVEEEPLVRHRSQRIPSGTTDSVTHVGQLANSPPSSPGPHSRYPHHNREAFPAEWGGISSEEHDEAVMLEAAMFGGIPETDVYRFDYPSQMGSERNTSIFPRIPRSPSPTLTAQRLLREQQDDEYLAALAADREKELKAMQEAELRHIEEEAAREAVLEQEKRHEEEAQRKLFEEEEYERLLAAKGASLPQEPALDDENAVTLLVRMPDGNRCGRRFLKSDKLQSLIDYIDVGRVVKPGTYRLVRPYPRRAFGEGEKGTSLGDLGLTSKQEALFLELI